MDIYPNIKLLADPLQCCERCYNFLSKEEAGFTYCTTCFFRIDHIMRPKSYEKTIICSSHAKK